MKKSTYILVSNLLMLFTSLNLYSQEYHKGIHQIQAEEFRIKDISISKKRSTEVIIPLQIEAVEEKKLGRVVFGFLPDWEYKSGAHNNIQYDALTHIAAFNWNVNSDGSITTPYAWPWVDVINAAHAKGTKVLMTVTHMKSWDYDSNAEIHDVMINPTKRNTLFNAIKTEINNSNLDGVNIDFEGFATEDRGDVINNFLRDLKAYLPSKEVSFAGPAINWGGWNFAGMVDHVDHLFIMAYDYDNNSSGIAQPVAPLYKGYSGYNQYIDRSLSVWYNDAILKNSEKVILGVPYYGRMFQTATNQLYSTIGEKRGSTRYYDIDQVYGGNEFWDTNSHTPWYTWNNGTEWLQVYMDDVKSLGEKYDMALDYNLGGIGIWALNYDRTRPELWDLIRDKFEGIPSLSHQEGILMKNMKVYPNPTRGLVNIKLSNEEKSTSIEVLNIHSQIVYSTMEETNIIDISNQVKGIYFVKVTLENGSNRVFKIVKK